MCPVISSLFTGIELLMAGVLTVQGRFHYALNQVILGFSHGLLETFFVRSMLPKRGNAKQLFPYFTDGLTGENNVSDRKHDIYCPPKIVSGSFRRFPKGFAC